MQLPSIDRRQLLLGGSLGAAALIAPRRIWAQPSSGSVRFLVLGDWGRRGGARQGAVAQRMAHVADGWRPSFVLTTGDNFYDFGLSNPSDSHWDQSFERVYTAGSLMVPWYPVLGNHDWGGDVVAQLRPHSVVPNRWQMPGLWYRVDTGNPDVAIFMIDTIVWKGSEKFPQSWSGARPREELKFRQEEWLRQELRNSQARMKIVVGHHGIYSIGKHGGSREYPELDNILHEFGVTAYVNGHDHCLYHICAGHPTDEGVMHYICSGGGSEELDRYTGGRSQGCVLPLQCPNPQEPGSFPVWLNYHPRAGFASIEADAHRLRVQFHDRDSVRGIVWQTDIPARQRPPTSAGGAGGAIRQSV